LAVMGGPDSLFSYGCAWANLSNTPLSLYKHYAHEGGIRTPMIAHWPNRIRNAGGFRHHLAHVMDVMATCVDVAGADYPVTFDGREILPLEGRSLLPALLDQPESPRTLIFEHERNAAIRVGDWKLVAHAGLARDGLREDARLELFNVRADPAEQQDLADEEPARVETLARRFVEEARRTFVLPAP
jgi:arylsulfatase A-like enzyme